ncbi:MAG: phosphatidylinositol kinase [Candidatus Angelobacter sp. Gp1-AA117]|nr:MAG: phosphatidylinositol kinase [Candidatus Angelobacter sp. Gp1-AA117]
MHSTETLRAVQHIRRMSGGSQSHLIRASDKNFYVVKFQNNAQDIRILANEYFAGKLGRLLGLSMPEVKIIDVSEWLITNTEELRIQSAGLSIPCSSGLQFGSHYVGDFWQQEYVFDYLPESLFERIQNHREFSLVLAFDKWTGNTDGRQAVFTKQERGYRVTFIDQGHCFNAAAWTFPDLALHGVYYKNHVYKHVTSWISFDPVLSRIESIRESALWEIAKAIPPEWYKHDTQAISLLIKTLYNRRALIRDLITGFRMSSRNPFPNWVQRKEAAIENIVL